MRAVNGWVDINHVLRIGEQIALLSNLGNMFFSKSFGYAVRGVLYIALMQDEQRYVQVEQIASCLSVPRHFMGKILKKMVKEKILESVKGPQGGFCTNASTLTLPLIRLIDITDGMETFNTCVLRMKECNSVHPCPMHFHMQGVKANFKAILSDTTLGDLLSSDKPEFIQSISTGNIEQLLLNKSEKIF
jgi:Rrf2 family transcriptional regulator, iron-sulfur cluster assembly transcription factor